MLVQQQSVTDRPAVPFTRTPLAASLTEANFAPVNIYWDFASILIAAQHVSLARKGIVSSPEEAASKGLSDPSLRISGTGLLKLVAGLHFDPTLINATCVLSTRRGQPSLIAPALARDGWYPIVRELAFNGREKNVDTTLAGEMIEDALVALYGGIDPADVSITLLAGDADYVDALERIHRYGFQVNVMGWAHSLSYRLRQLAANCTELDDFFQLVTFRSH